MRKSSIKPAHPPIWHPTKEYQWNKAATKDGTLPKRRKYLLLISFSALSTRRKVVYLYISKAFDTINHVILLKKLENIGLSVSAPQWFESYLSQRYQAVRINSVLSDTLPVVSGVPQGSFLGALLFGIYVNDQPTVCQTVQPRATWMTPSFYCLLPWTTPLVL